MGTNLLHLSSPSLVFLIIAISGLFGHTTKAIPNFLDRECEPENKTSTNATYQANLNILLSLLASNSTAPNGFYNLSIGSEAPNIVYGLFLCRGDVRFDICQDCVAAARENLLKYCPKKKVGTAYYDECMLRFSNEYIFSTVTVDVGIALWDELSVPRNDFKQAVVETVNQTAAQAASGSAKKFATKEAKLTQINETLYTLAQCTPDLSSADCWNCLQICIPSLHMQNKGSRVLYPSCTVRFELYPFYFGSLTAPAPAPAFPPPPVAVHAPPPSRPTSGEQRISTALMAILVPITVSALLFTAFPPPS
ncbi:Gnk2-homologous domain [Dillenia turbinata]|uniref:Gnk2-homologous domain n=1 Tax=Dillenia turbinata TaxID=194707 RepID=A0AAN8ZF29_9MAGN